MTLSIKKLYYSLSPEKFSEKLAEARNDPSAVSLQLKPYFFLRDSSVDEAMLKMHHAQADFDDLYASFSSFTRKQIIQSFFIDEIQSTNKIEDIHSTTHDIFTAMQNIQTADNKHILSIVHSYQMLMDNTHAGINDFTVLRSLYDHLMEDAYENSEDRPDGEYFRKKQVFITDGMQNIHHGCYPESAINTAMHVFLEVYNNSSFDIYLRLILSHFLLEIIHPFYDGNGRFGRFLFSKGLYDQEKTYSAFLISSCINRNRAKYYKAFRTAEDIHEYGCLNQYIEIILTILTDGFRSTCRDLTDSQSKILHKVQKTPLDWNKSEKTVYRFLTEASFFTYFGITTEEIQQETGLSRRTVQYALSYFRSLGILQETKVGKYTYHKIQEAC